MGTSFNLVIYGSDSVSVQQVASLAWKRIDEINEVFSDYSSTSELYQIHQHSRTAYFPVSTEFEKVLKVSLIYSKMTHGAFDISIGALSRIWRRAVKMNDFPSADQINEALKAVGYKKIKLKDGFIKLPPGMYLDFGAIAKGYAVDEAYRIIYDLQFPVVLVDGGGDIYAGDPPPGTEGWSITSQIRDARGMVKDTLVHIKNASIVTSGDAYKYIENKGKRYSHIIHPKSGFGIPGPHWVTVRASQAIHADALATALSVLPMGRIKQFRKKWNRMFKSLDSNWYYSMFRPQE